MFEFDGWNQKKTTQNPMYSWQESDEDTRKDTGVVGETGPTLASCTTLDRSNNKRTIRLVKIFN